MPHVTVHDDTLDLESPVLVEGLPGVGLVGKLATDHIVDTLEMTHYASCLCEGLPDVPVYHGGDSAVAPPVRIYADEDRDLLALQSDVPVSTSEADCFAECLTEWLVAQSATPLYLSGLPAEKEEGRPALHGIATGGADHHLTDHDIAPPGHDGLISGPTGSLLYQAYRDDVAALGLVVQASKDFPDPEAARVLIVDAINPIAGTDVPTADLAEQAEEVAEARQELAERMGQASEESSQAQPLGMFQ
ncbi:MAG: proteasome assembly chaperone family protein [Halorientalis sp.]